jgi:hypothetical protein
MPKFQQQFQQGGFQPSGMPMPKPTFNPMPFEGGGYGGGKAQPFSPIPFEGWGFGGGKTQPFSPIPFEFQPSKYLPRKGRYFGRNF